MKSAAFKVAFQSGFVRFGFAKLLLFRQLFETRMKSYSCKLLGNFSISSTPKLGFSFGIIKCINDDDDDDVARKLLNQLQ